ncbi:hypothetical protein ASZ78_012831, partial [Callipepla squamata]
ALGVMLLMFGLWLLFDRNNLFSVLLYVFSSPGVFHPDCHISTDISEERSGNLSTPQTTVCKVYHQWNNRIDEVISEYGNKSLAEKEPVWNILNAVQQNVRKTQNVMNQNLRTKQIL